MIAQPFQILKSGATGIRTNVVYTETVDLTTTPSIQAGMWNLYLNYLSNWLSPKITRG